MKRLLYILTLLVTPMPMLSAQSSVQGIVTTTNGDVVEGADVIYNSYLVSSTDGSGRFSCIVPDDAELLIYRNDYKPQKSVLDSRREITVVLDERRVDPTIADSVVMDCEAIVVDNSNIEIKGNYLHLTTTFRVPKRLFTRDNRFIAQPTLYDSTLDIRQNLTPIVMDGDKYSVNIYRKLNFDLTNDRLSSFKVDEEALQNEYICQYEDSLYVTRDRLDNLYQSDCLYTLVSYRPKQDNYKVDTVTIARGTRNPLRLLDYALEPMDLTSHVLSLDDGSPVSLEYSSVIPDQELDIFSENGSSKIVFRINETQIDYSNPNNRRSIDAIVDVLKEIQQNKDAVLRSISMTGYASPDGSYASNKKLADIRTKALLDIVTRMVDSEVLESATLNHRGEVQSWAALIDIAKADRNYVLADKIASNIAKFGDHNASIQTSIISLPEYRGVIGPRYMPELRKVDYMIDYGIMKPLRFEDIKAAALSGERLLSRYEYYRLISEDGDHSLVESFEDEALTIYPDFVWVLNRVAARILRSGRSRIEIMSPILGRDVPMPVTYNHTLMALQERDIIFADSLIQGVNQYRECNYLRSIIGAFNGRIEEVYPYISSRGGFNEVVIKLSMSEDKDAYELASLIIDDELYHDNAKAWYVYAMCANRVKRGSEAIKALRRAFELDASLVEIAKIDADVLAIYEQMTLR